jgi:nucleotide-binding universal stress UspA family protein
VQTKAERKEKKMPGIIVGVDGSGHSRRALDWAIHEAAIRHAPLTVLTVQQAMASFWAEDARPPEISVLAVPGFPAEEILGVAKDADMIVVGSRGAGGFKKLLMGSVASQVTHHAHVPVVVIPAENS